MMRIPCSKRAAALGLVVGMAVAAAVPARASIPPGRQTPPNTPPLNGIHNDRTGLVVLVHGWRSDPTVWSNQMAANIVARLTDIGTEDSWDVVAYDWRNDANTLRPNGARTNGNTIGVALGVNLALGINHSTYAYTRVHVIGHSAGAWLIDGIARGLAPVGVSVHETFLDAYVPVPANQCRLGARGTFGESYVDNRETTILRTPTDTNPTMANAYNLDVTALEDPPSATFPDQHAWPWRWYMQTTVDPNAAIANSWGFRRSSEWGILPSHNTYARGARVSVGGPDAPGDLFDGNFGPPVDFGAPGRSQTAGSVAIAGTGVTLQTASPAWIVRNTDVPYPVNYLTFAWEFQSPSTANGWLTVYIDRNRNGSLDDPDDLVYEFGEVGAETGRNVEFIPLDDVLPAGPSINYDIAFRLDTFGGTASTVVISDLRLGLIGYCFANCDGSSAAPFLNVNDFSCFLNRFSAGDPYANCDNSSTPPLLNVNDFLCYINRFAQGCTTP